MRMTERRRIMKQLELSKVKLLGAKKAPIEELQAAAVWCDAHAEQRKLKLHELHPDMVEYGHVYTGEYVLVSSFTINRIRSHIDRARFKIGFHIRDVMTPSMRAMTEAWYWLERYWAPGRWIAVKLRWDKPIVDGHLLANITFSLDCRYNAIVAPICPSWNCPKPRKLQAVIIPRFSSRNKIEREIMSQDGWRLLQEHGRIDQPLTLYRCRDHVEG